MTSIISPTLLDLLGDAYTQTKDCQSGSCISQSRGLDPSETVISAVLDKRCLRKKVIRKRSGFTQNFLIDPDDADVYLRMAQITANSIRWFKAEETLVKARSILLAASMSCTTKRCCIRAQGRYEDAIRVLSEAVTGVKGNRIAATRRRSLAWALSTARAAVSRHAKLSGSRNTYERNRASRRCKKIAGRAFLVMDTLSTPLPEGLRPEQRSRRTKISEGSPRS